MLRRGFDLPPLMFTADELDVIVVGARLVRRLRDPGLHRAAETVLDKIRTALPEARRGEVSAAPFFVSDGSIVRPEGIELPDLRRAIRETRKVRIAYRNAQGAPSERTVWPLAMAYYVDVTLLGAWCELRKDFRNFRVERITASTITEERFPTEGGKLMERWFALQGPQLSAG